MSLSLDFNILIVELVSSISLEASFWRALIFILRDLLASISFSRAVFKVLASLAKSDSPFVSLHSEAFSLVPRVSLA